MKLIDITAEQPKETIEMIKAGRKYELSVMILNDEYKIIHSFDSGLNRVSVSHLNFEIVPHEIIIYLVEDYLKTDVSNVEIFKTAENSPIIHIHEKNRGANNYADLL